jgi:4-amino-4-deoxy-L-arabinose transferase-like glycosyltransferase
MLILLIIASFLLCCSILWLKETSPNNCLRIAILKTFIIHGILISVFTEGTSLVQSLTSHSVALFWLVIDLINAIILFYLFRYKLGFIITKQRVQRVLFNFRDIDGISRFSLVAVFVVLLITITTALIAPPNNWDSMNYHMPRVMHWIQNQSVRQYPINYLHQISFPPGAAYIVMQFQLLAGSDRFANCVQWLALFGSIIGISLLTNLLVSKRDQWISALVCISIPMAIMQSMTTQTDLTTAFWLICQTYFVFKNDTYSKQDLFWISASLGLAILTKPTALIFGLPLSVFLVLRLFKKLSLTRFVITIGGLLIAIFSLSLPSYWRNYQTFSTFLGSDAGTRATEFGFTPFISTLLKNLINIFPISIFRNLVNFIHIHILDFNINAPQTSGFSHHFMEEPLLQFLAPHEDFVSSPIHVLLFCFGALALILKFKQLIFNNKNNNRVVKDKVFNLFILTCTILVSFILFCVLLKWQTFHNRLLLPIFILSTPVITYYIRNFFHLKVQRLMLILFALTAIFYALTPMRHPMISLPILSKNQIRAQSQSIFQLDRKDIYFSGSRKELQAPYHAAVDIISQRQCLYIGLDANAYYLDWEYAFWVLLKSNLQQPFKLKHINIQNVSKKLAPEFHDSQMCAIISSIDLDTPHILDNQQSWQKLTNDPQSYPTVYVR